MSECNRNHLYLRPLHNTDKEAATVTASPGSEHDRLDANPGMGHPSVNGMF